MKPISAIPHRWLTIGIVACSFLMLARPAAAQPLSAFEGDYIFWGYPASYLGYQSKVAFPLIDRMLAANPPAHDITPARQLTLVALDQFLHDPDYSRKDDFYSFVNTRFCHALAAMDKPVIAGVKVIKVYNSGFVLKTLKTTVAIDIIRGGSNYKPFMSDSVFYELVSRCDALLITNQDNKHADRKVAEAFLNAGKPVYLPTGLWTNLGDDVHYVGADTVQTVDANGMLLHVLPGHNGKTRNNIYIMDFQGRGMVAHTGAQDNDADWDWLSDIHNQYAIDLLITKSANINLADMLTAFAPRVLIPAHENEMESTVDKRDAYWAVQKRMNSLSAQDIPYVVMAWGEAFDYADTASENISSSANKVFINGKVYIERKGVIYTPTGIKVNESH